MIEHAWCPRCRHENPPENRFCGSCGASLEASSDLVARRGNKPTVMSHGLPANLGPASKAVAVALATLAAQAGLSWLRHRAKAGDRRPTLTTRRPGTAASERLFGQGLEEVLIHKLEGEHRSWVFAQRTMRSFVITEPTDRRS
jgi:hypothetical protein